jgi:hypothetical protein
MGLARLPSHTQGQSKDEISTVAELQNDSGHERENGGPMGHMGRMRHTQGFFENLYRQVEQVILVARRIGRAFTLPGDTH